MQNWIGVAIWIALGAVIGLAMKGVMRRGDDAPGHTVLLAVLGAFGAVVGGMLGVGILQFEDPSALSLGGMAGAVVLGGLLSWIYRWGTRALI
jgi:hypothetical protein